MRRLVSATALTLAASAFAVVAPASGEPAEQGSQRSERRAGLRCDTAVVSVDEEGRVRDDWFTNERLVRSNVSTATLPFGVTAWGTFDTSAKGRRVRSQLNAVAADGTPRNVTLARGRSSVRIGKVRSYDQDSFTPRLFADGPGFYAYTVGGDTLKRWTLTRFPDGDMRFAQPVRLGKGFRDLTSLQAIPAISVRGVVSEILYATTASGALRQIVVPVAKPQRTRVRRLAATGYAGVTELSWTYCNGKASVQSLIAIDPTANRATWTVIRRALTRPKATLRSEVTGVTDWGITAAI